MKEGMPQYEAPKIEDYGDLFELTSLETVGGQLDKDFPSGTPGPQLTFS